MISFLIATSGCSRLFALDSNVQSIILRIIRHVIFVTIFSAVFDFQLAQCALLCPSLGPTFRVVQGSFRPTGVLTLG
jgi:hypothetical protein